MRRARRSQLCPHRAIRDRILHRRENRDAIDVGARHAVDAHELERGPRTRLGSIVARETALLQRVPEDDPRHLDANYLMILADNARLAELSPSSPRRGSIAIELPRSAQGTLITNGRNAAWQR